MINYVSLYRAQSEGTVHSNSKLWIMYHYIELSLKEQFTQIQNYELCIIIQSSIWRNSSPKFNLKEQFTQIQNYELCIIIQSSIWRNSSHKFKIMNYVSLYRAQSEGTVHPNSIWRNSSHKFKIMNYVSLYRAQSEGTVHTNSKLWIMYHYTELNLKEQFTQIQNYELCIIIQSSIWRNSSHKFKIMNYVSLYRAQSEGTVHSNSKLWIMYHYTELNLKEQFTQIQNDELCIIIQSIIQVS